MKSKNLIRKTLCAALISGCLKTNVVSFGVTKTSAARFGVAKMHHTHFNPSSAA